MLTIKSGVLQKFLPLAIYHFIFLIILGMNFPYGKYFYGWDGLYPELNFSLNFERALSAGWQENYAFGTMGGHGFAATLPHTFITWILSFVFSTISIRPVFTFLCLYLGGLGMYLLCKKILTHHLFQTQFIIQTSFVNIYSLIGASYYLLNLVTVQMFALQLEAFIVHYAALPWLIWIFLRILENKNIKNWTLFIVINFFASVQGFIPPLFITYLMIIFPLFLLYLFYEKFSFKSLKEISLIGITIFSTNAYWLLTFFYYLLTQQSIYLNSYNNLKSTSEFIEKSQSYGDLQNTIFLKSFFWEGFQLGGWIFDAFRQYQEHFVIIFIGYFFFLLIIVGIISGLFFTKSWIIRGLIITWVLLFTLLTTETPPFSWLTQALQWISPSFTQSFRIAFTKVGIGVIFTQSLLFVLGFIGLINLNSKFLKQKLYSYFLSFSILIILIVFSWPIFTGNLLYRGSLVNIPNSYFELINLINKNPNKRIMELPQSCSDGWYSLKWGYIGSGFLWYGLQQPIMSRSADVWSNYSEAYYWELIYSLNTENYDYFDVLLQKYNIDLIILDENTIGCFGENINDQSEKIKKHLLTSSKYSLVKKIDSNNSNVLPLWLYEKKGNLISSKGVNLYQNLPSVQNNFHYTWKDHAYLENGNYISSNIETQKTIYPFPSLFSNRLQKDLEVNIKETEQEISLKSKPLNNTSGQESWQLKIPNIVKTSRLIPVKVTSEIQEENKLQVSFEVSIPTIITSNKTIQYSLPVTLALDLKTCPDINNCYLVVGYQNKVKIDIGKKGQELGFAIIDPQLPFILGLGEENSLDLFQTIEFTLKDFASLFDIDPIQLQLADKSSITLHIPKFANGTFNQNFVNEETGKIPPKNCQNLNPNNFNKTSGSENNERFIEYQAKNASSCDTFYIENLPHNNGFIFKITSQNISGNPFKLGIQNPLLKKSEINTVLRDKNSWNDNWFIIPPLDLYDQGYTVFLDTLSQDQNESKNRVKNIQVWPFPYEWINTLKLQKSETAEFPIQSLNITNLINTNKKAIWWYEVSFPEINSGKSWTLNLAQSYHEGWKAFVIQNNGLQFLKHLKINNWANGWEVLNLAGNTTVYLIFWPQILEYLGFGLFFITLGGIGIYWKLKKKKSNLIQ